MTCLIIARHGNTFESGEAPRRVGLRTDLPLTQKGIEQGRAIGRYLKKHDIVPDHFFTSELIRTKQTAKAALDECGCSLDIFTNPIFNEIDYGPDENKTEDEVIARLGEEALIKWDSDAIVPDGWMVDPAHIIQSWLDFGNDIIKNHNGQNVMVVTSNGIARFAPYLTGDFESFANSQNIKIATGAICILEFIDGTWRIKKWNIRPDKIEI